MWERVVTQNVDQLHNHQVCPSDKSSGREGNAIGYFGLSDGRESNMRVILSYAFRPFFLLNGLFGVVVVVAWLALLSGRATLFGIPDPVMWHAHEMLVGFIMATIAGFVLTAGANWTGRPPVTELRAAHGRLRT